MAVTIETLRNAWKVAKTNYANSNGAFRSTFASQLVPFLVSRENRAAGGMSIMGIEQALNQNEKNLYVAKVKQRKYINRNALSPDTSEGFCDITGEQIKYLVTPYQLNRKTTAIVTIDGDAINCSEESRMRAFEDNYAALVEMATSRFATEVEAEAFAKINATQYRHIGNLPTLDGTVRPAGETLPLFRAANNEINFTGDAKLQTDVMLAGIMANKKIGNTLFRSYAKLQSISGLNNIGYDFGQLDAIRQAEFLFSDDISTRSGIAQPLLVLAAGAWQIVTHAEFAVAPEAGANIVKTSITDPIFGLTWNLITRLDECSGRRFTTTYILELDWTFISTPQCAIGDLRRDGTNGALLYSIICSDANLCSLPQIEALYFVDNQAPNDCASDTTTALCGTGCNVALASFLEANDLIVTANANPSQGATIITYEWLVAGVAYGGNIQIITIDYATLANGDVIQVTVTDSLGCVAVNSFVVVK